eukprot:8981182-Karenia_brevis.AAC.1
MSQLMSRGGRNESMWWILPGARQVVDKGADVSWRGRGQAFELFWGWAYNASDSGRPDVSEAV